MRQRARAGARAPGAPESPRSQSERVTFERLKDILGLAGARKMVRALGRRRLVVPSDADLRRYERNQRLLRQLRRKTYSGVARESGVSMRHLQRLVT